MIFWQQYAISFQEDTDDYQTHELLLHIREAIGKLPEKFREAFVKHRFENSSYKEIARELNVSSKTVDYRIQQALKLLREDLKEYLDDDSHISPTSKMILKLLL